MHLGASKYFEAPKCIRSKNVLKNASKSTRTLIHQRKICLQMRLGAQMHSKYNLAPRKFHVCVWGGQNAGTK